MNKRDDEYWENTVGIKGNYARSAAEIADSSMIAGVVLVIMTITMLVAIIGAAIKCLICG